MRQIDNMDEGEIEMLRVKNMISTLSFVDKALGLVPAAVDRKRIDIQMQRIGACDILLDYVHDDIPHSEQQPISDQLNVLRGRLTDEMEDALTP